jgi:hypothetical protein
LRRYKLVMIIFEPDKCWEFLKGCNVSIWEQETLIDDDIPLQWVGTSLAESKPTGKYYLAVNVNVSEEYIGIGKNSELKLIVWELVREELLNNKAYLILKGWGKSQEETLAFEGVEIALLKNILKSVLYNFEKAYPNYYTVEKLSNIIGLNFEES